MSTTSDGAFEKWWMDYINRNGMSNPAGAHLLESREMHARAAWKAAFTRAAKICREDRCRRSWPMNGPDTADECARAIEAEIAPGGGG